MTQGDAVTRRTKAASIDDQANYVPTAYIIGYVITVLAVTWTSIGLARAAGISIKLYDPWHGIVFSNLTMLIPTIIAVVFNTLQRKPARVQLRPLTRHITAKSVIFAVAFPLVFIFGIAALCLVTGFGTAKPGCAWCSVPKHASFHFDRRDGNLIPFWIWRRVRLACVSAPRSHCPAWHDARYRARRSCLGVLALGALDPLSACR